MIITTLEPVSGAHFNPAVTLAMWLRGEIGTTEALAYVVVQCGAAVLGVWLARSLTDTFARIRPGDAPAFILAQIVGAIAAVVLAGWMFADRDHGDV